MHLATFYIHTLHVLKYITSVNMHDKCKHILIGTANEFKRKFENPILRGRDADATDDEHKRGKAKLAEVSRITRCMPAENSNLICPNG